MEKRTFSSVPKDILRLMILLILLSFLNLLFHFFLFVFYHGFFEDLTSMSPLSILFNVELVFNILILGIIPYGFLSQKRLSRSVMIGFFLFSSVINFFSIPYYQENVFMYYFLFVASVFALMSLLMSQVKTYFTQVQPKKGDIEEKASEYLQIDDYILHEQMVKMRNGSMQMLYYFSKGISEKGTPCQKPDQYDIRYNKKTKVPYLKKKQGK